eukprot:2375576-Pleurochrysis_carterae.AAC.1
MQLPNHETLRVALARGSSEEIGISSIIRELNGGKPSVLPYYMRSSYVVEVRANSLSFWHMLMLNAAPSMAFSAALILYPYRSGLGPVYDGGKSSLGGSLRR